MEIIQLLNPSGAAATILGQVVKESIAYIPVHDTKCKFIDIANKYRGNQSQTHAFTNY